MFCFAPGARRPELRGPSDSPWRNKSTYTPSVLRQQKSRFAAQTLAQVLAALLVGGGILSAVWVINLNQASASLKVTLVSQTKELEGLRAALEQSKQSSAPAELAMAQRSKPGGRHCSSAKKCWRLCRKACCSQAMVMLHACSWWRKAFTVVWVTSIKADDRLLEVAGYTLEPAAQRLGQPVGGQCAVARAGPEHRQGRKRQARKTLLQPVVGAAPQSAAKPAGAAASGAPVASAVAPVLPPVWSYSLLSSTVMTPANSAATRGQTMKQMWQAQMVRLDGLSLRERSFSIFVDPGVLWRAGGHPVAVTGADCPQAKLSQRVESRAQSCNACATACG